MKLLLLLLDPPHDRQIRTRRRTSCGCWILRYPAKGPIVIILQFRDRKITPAVVEEEVLIAVVVAVLERG